MKKLRGKMMLTKQIAGAESIVMKLHRKSNNFLSGTSHVIVDDMQICYDLMSLYIYNIERNDSTEGVSF